MSVINISQLITVTSLYLSTCKTETSEAILLIRSHCTIRMVLKLILQGKNVHTVTLIICESQALFSANREMPDVLEFHHWLFHCFQCTLSPLGLHDEADRSLLQVKDQRRVPVLSTETAQERVRAGRD